MSARPPEAHVLAEMLEALGDVSTEERQLLAWMEEYGWIAMRRGGLWTFPGCKGVIQAGGVVTPEFYVYDCHAKALEIRGLAERTTDARGNVRMSPARGA